jgi:hypothetical protein
MAKDKAEGLPPREPGVNEVTAQFTRQFRERLEAVAEEIYLARKANGGVTAEHVEAAYKRLTAPIPGPRDPAQKNIRAALKANRIIEFASYVMAAILFLLGIFLIVYGVLGPVDVAGRVAALIGGPVTSLLLLLPWRFAINARRHNVAISLLGFLLDRVDDPRLLSRLIRQLLNEVAPRKTAP